MDARMLMSVSSQLDEYLGRFHGHFCRSEQRRQLALYSRGRLGPLERKSLEPIALSEDSSPRTLQQFLERHVWNEEGLLDQFQRLVAQELGAEDGIFIADGTSDAKKGTQTAGVARQYCGETGKIDNCIVTMHWAYAGRDGAHVLLDGELYLPKSWDASAGREAVELREKTGIPADAKYQTHIEMSIRQLGRIKDNGVPGRWVTGDEEFGRSWQWREEVQKMGYTYVAEVPCDLRGYKSEPRFRIPRASRTRGRKSTLPKTDAIAVEARDLAAKGKLHYQPWKVHEGTKGPEVWMVARLPFFSAVARKPGQTQAGVLLIADNVLTGERKFFFSNAAKNTPTGALLRVAFSRWRVERCFQDAKGELGLNHAETRSWKSIKRHLILTCILHLFLTLRRREWGEKDATPDPAPDGTGHRTNARGRNDIPDGTRREAATGGENNTSNREDSITSRQFKTFRQKTQVAHHQEARHQALRYQKC